MFMTNHVRTRIVQEESRSYMSGAKMNRPFPSPSEQEEIGKRAQLQ